MGADGAYSAVRQSLYKQLTESKILPASDSEELKKGYTCVVGTTNSLDPTKFPILTTKNSGGVLVIGDEVMFCVSWIPQFYLHSATFHRFYKLTNLPSLPYLSF